MVEQLTVNQEVAGSSPAIPAKYAIQCPSLIEGDAHCESVVLHAQLVQIQLVTHQLSVAE